MILTVNVTLSLICLCDKQVRHVPANVVLVTHSIAAENFLKSAFVLARYSTNRFNSTYTLAFTSALSQFCLLIMEIISGATLPSSFSLPT